MSSLIRRKEITIAIMVFCSFFVFADRVYKADILLDTSKTIQTWVLAIAAVTMLVSFTSSIISNAKNIQLSLGSKVSRTESTSRMKGLWFYNGVALITAVLTVLVGLTMGVQSPPYQWMYTYVFRNLSTAIASFLALFYISAAFRAFRARTVEASVLLIMAFFVILTTNPFGEALWSGFPVIGNFFLNWLQLPGSRGLGLATGVGTIALAFRVILGYEKSVSAGGD